MSRLGFAGFVAGSVLVVLLSMRIFVLPVGMVMVNMAHFVTEAPWRLWGHLLGGPLALLLAPVQLWTGLRLRAAGLHRWSGRIYGLAVLVAGLAGLTLAPTSEASLFARAGFMVLAVVWLGSTAMGVAMAVRGDYARHEWWMQRSLALTFSAVTLRLIMLPLMAGGWTIAQTYDVTAWGAWVLNLTVLEVWQRRGRAPQLA